MTMFLRYLNNDILAVLLRVIGTVFLRFLNAFLVWNLCADLRGLIPALFSWFVPTFFLWFIPTFLIWDLPAVLLRFLPTLLMGNLLTFTENLFGTLFYVMAMLDRDLLALLSHRNMLA